MINHEKCSTLLCRAADMNPNFIRNNLCQDLNESKVLLNSIESTVCEIERPQKIVSRTHRFMNLLF